MRRKIDALMLDSHEANIPLPISKVDLITLLSASKIAYSTPSETRLLVRSAVFSLDFEFMLAFGFNNDTLLNIVMSPMEALSGKAALERYRSIRSAMEVHFGRPRNWLRRLASRLDPYDQCANWQFENATIEHRLLDRFGIEDTVTISF